MLLWSRMIGAIVDHDASGTGPSRIIALSFNEPAATAPLWLPPQHIDNRWRGALTSAPRRKSICCGTAATLFGYQGYTIPRRDTCLHDGCIACPASDAAARMTWRNHRLQPSSKAALLERVAQDCSNLAIQHFQTAAKLQLFVRHDALDGDFNDDRQARNRRMLRPVSTTPAVESREARSRQKDQETPRQSRRRP